MSGSLAHTTDSQGSVQNFEGKMKFLECMALWAPLVLSYPIILRHLYG